jgi:hypothetical protein
MRIELTTSSLPRRCSTTELPGQTLLLYELCLLLFATVLLFAERETGFEPATFSLEG